MNIQIQTPHLKYKEDLNDLIREKFERVFAPYSYVTNCRVFLKAEEQAIKNACEIEAYVHLTNGELFASNKADTFQEALPGLMDKLKRQLEKYKQKVYTNP
jgi:putative sigma-54 modulation protein